MTAEFRPDSRWTHAQGRRHHAFPDDVRDGNDSGADEFFFVQMADTQLGMQDQFRKGMGAHEHAVLPLSQSTRWIVCTHRSPCYRTYRRAEPA